MKQKPKGSLPPAESLRSRATLGLKLIPENDYADLSGQSLHACQLLAGTKPSNCRVIPAECARAS